MTNRDDMRRRLARLLLEHEQFTADDVTAAGAEVPDAGHRPNSRNSVIGSVFSQAAKAGYIRTVGIERSKAKHRKGGTVRVWSATEVGRRWARALVSP